jgi:hypothetical protein
VEHGDFAAKYMQWKDIAKFIVFPVTDSSQSATWKAECVMARFKVALDQAWAANFARVAGRVHIVLKKGVVAKADIDTGEMVIVPLTTKISFVLASSHAPGTVGTQPDVQAHDFGYEANGKKYVCVIKGSAAKDVDKSEDVVLYFNTIPSEDRAEATMVRATVNITVQGKPYKVPVLINVVLIKADDALHTYAKAISDPTAELAVVPIAPFPKPNPKATAAGAETATAQVPKASVVTAKASIAPRVPKPPVVTSPVAATTVAAKRGEELKREKAGPWLN